MRKDALHTHVLYVLVEILRKTRVIGEWVNGMMEGVGRLTAANGDFYQGMFRKHK